MIRTFIKVGDGNVEDLYECWGMIYISSDTRFAAPSKKRESTTYAEQSGENIDRRSVADAFDYKIMLLVECENGKLTNANTKIKAFNTALFDSVDGSDVQIAKEVSFINPYKRIKIVGTPNVISEAKSFFRDNSGNVHDAVQVEWTIRVNNPNKCDFSYQSGND